MIIRLIQGMLIFPGAATQGTRASAVSGPADGELVRLNTSSGERVAALFGPALDPDGQPIANAHECPIIVFFYGSGATLARSLDLAFELRTMGANVLIPDYVGYGMSTGRPSEQGCYETAAAALDWLKS